MPPRRPVHIVFSSHDLPPTLGHTGLAGNAPEERKRLVQRALRSLPASSLCSYDLVTRPESSLALAGLVHDHGMVRFLEQAWEEWAREWAKIPNRHLVGVFCHLDGEGNHPPPFVPGFFAPRQDGMQRPGEGVLNRACFYATDRETPIHESTVLCLRWDLAVIQRSVQLVVGEKKDAVVYAQITHPGHHAGPSAYGGFCFVNQAAVGVRMLKQRGFKRVAVVDVDYHAGNGTMAVFWNDPSVFVASLHGDPEHEYPFNAGFPNQIGGPEARGTKLNISLPGGTDWNLYKPALQKVIDAVKEFKADVLVVSLGVDTLRDDPVALPQSRFVIDSKDYVEMGDLLFGLNLPTLVVQEGGYKLDRVAHAITAFLTGEILPIEIESKL